MATLNPRVLASVSALAVTLFASWATAHISLDQASTHKSRYGEEQKFAPCGRQNGEKGSNIYTYKPGETITVEFVEYVKHPGYYRFAFDNDGDDDFVSPVSIKPVDPARPCPFNATDMCGESDFYNSDTVLPGMDNLEPHLAGESKGTYSFQVKLPNVQCENCTLQLLQVMEDTIHGAYNVDPTEGSLPDVYYQCIDIKLVGPLEGAGGTGAGAAPAEDDGCSVTPRQASGAEGLLVVLGVAGWFGIRRRR
jgi:MYXO-CTERM domain-containing protein